MDVQNLIHLDELTEETILSQLVHRFERDQIYTHLGEVLVSVNPYRSIPNLYGHEATQVYSKASPERTDGGLLDALPPHLFGIAELCLRRAVVGGLSQSIIISGESGAGKTEATKLLLYYFSRRGQGSRSSMGLEKKIMDANPVMEAFGNARTVRNHNSSRFGKFIQLFVGPRGSIDRASVSKYLLEKSRVVHQSPGERNYHAFYYLLAGAPQELRHELQLSDPDAFHYLRQGRVPHSAAEDAKHFAKLRDALVSVGVPLQRHQAIWRLLAGILHLGQVEFGDFSPSTPRDQAGRAIRGATNAKYIEACQVSGDSRAHLEAAAGLLGVAAGALELYLTTREIRMPGSEPMRAALKTGESFETRDSTAKALYDALFTWLVDTINVMLSKQSAHASAQPSPSIGILDIFGFEVFRRNSFEQMCINWANERLNEHFMRHVVFNEMEEYARQGVQPPNVANLIASRAECLELLEGKPLGLFSLLDEESRFPSATDASYLQKALHQHLGRNPHFDKVKTSPSEFVVNHFAGPVAYHIDGLLDKNRDALPSGFLDLFQPSQFDFIRILLPASPAATEQESAQSASRGARKNIATLGNAFRSQLLGLSAILEASQSSYIRCIKPNDAQSASSLDRELIHRQLCYSGLLSASLIRKEGFSVRFGMQEFYHRFGFISPSSTLSSSTSSSSSSIQNVLPTIQHCQQLCQRLNLPSSDFQIGHTKVFLKIKLAQSLEDQRNRELLSRIQRIQSWWRMHMLRNRFLSIRRAVVIIQRAFRRFWAQECLNLKLAATIVIQSWTRGYFARRLLHRLRIAHHQRIQDERDRLQAAEERLALERQSISASASEELVPLVDLSAVVDDRNEKTTPQKTAPSAPLLASQKTAESLRHELAGSLTTRLARKADLLQTPSDTLFPERNLIQPPPSIWTRLVDLPPSALVSQWIPDPSPPVAKPTPSPSTNPIPSLPPTPPVIESDLHPLQRLFIPPTPRQSKSDEPHPSPSSEGKLAQSLLRVAAEDRDFCPLPDFSRTSASSAADTEATWMEYCRLNFNKQRSAGLGPRRKWLPLEALSSFSLSSLSLPLLKQISLLDSSKTKLVGLASALASSILSFLTDSGRKHLPSDSSLRRVLKNVLSPSLLFPALRNEAYAWLIKLSVPSASSSLASSNSTSGEESVLLRQLRISQLFALFGSCFIPEDQALDIVIQLYLATPLGLQTADSRSYLSKASSSLEAMSSSVISRVAPPSLLEVNSILANQDLWVSLFVTSFTTRECAVDSFTSVHDLIVIMLLTLGLTDRLASHFGIDHEYSVAPSPFICFPQPLYLRHLNSSSLVVDHIAQFEMDAQKYPDSLHLVHRFTLRRRIFLPFPVELSTSQSETHRELLYNQLMSDSEIGRLLFWGHRDPQLLPLVVSLRRQVERGDYLPNSGEDVSFYLLHLQRLKELLKAVPSESKSIPVASIASKALFINECTKLSGLDRRESVDRVLEIFMGLPYFGYHAFQVTLIDAQDLTSDAKRIHTGEKVILMAMSDDGLAIFSMRLKTLLYKIPLEGVVRFDFDSVQHTFGIEFSIPQRIFLRVSTRTDVGDLQAIFLHFWNFFCSQAPYARAVINHYVTQPLLLSFSQNDMLRITKRYLGGTWLEGYLLDLQSEFPRPISSSGIFPAHVVQLMPSIDSQSSAFNSANPLRGSAAEPKFATQTPLSLHSFSSEIITRPFLPSLPKELHPLAFEMFFGILQFMDDFPRIQDEETEIIAQQLLDTALDSSPLSDELILQICIQITRHPLPAHAILGYQLLALCLGLVYPPQLTAVVHRIQQVLDVSHPQFLQHAIYANERWRQRRSLFERSPTRHRSNPPSLLEIQCTLARTAIPIKLALIQQDSSQDVTFLSFRCQPLTLASQLLTSCLAGEPHSEESLVLQQHREFANDCSLLVAAPDFLLVQELSPHDFVADALYMIERRLPLAVLHIRRTSWSPALIRPANPIELDACFHQLSREFLNGLRVPSNPDDLIKLLSWYAIALGSERTNEALTALAQSPLQHYKRPLDRTLLIPQLLNAIASESVTLDEMSDPIGSHIKPAFCRLLMTSAIVSRLLEDEYSFETPILVDPLSPAVQQLPPLSLKLVASPSSSSLRAHRKQLTSRPLSSRLQNVLRNSGGSTLSSSDPTNVPLLGNRRAPSKDASKFEKSSQPASSADSTSSSISKRSKLKGSKIPEHVSSPEKPKEEDPAQEAVKANSAKTAASSLSRKKGKSGSNSLKSGSKILKKHSKSDRKSSKGSSIPESPLKQSRQSRSPAQASTSHKTLELSQHSPPPHALISTGLRSRALQGGPPGRRPPTRHRNLPSGSSDLPARDRTGSQSNETRKRSASSKLLKLIKM